MNHGGQLFRKTQQTLSIALLAAATLTTTAAQADLPSYYTADTSNLIAWAQPKAPTQAAPEKAVEIAVTLKPEKSLEERVKELEKLLKKEQAKDPLYPLEVDIIKKPTHQWRGRILFDHVSYSEDGPHNRQNEFGFDTIRVGVKGHVYENFKYQIEVEYEGTEVDFKDAYIQAENLPFLGNIRAGHFEEPFGLEDNQSGRFDTFMEQPYATSTFAPARNFGVMAFNHLDSSQDVTWWAGIFRGDSDDSPNGAGGIRQDADDWSLSSRIAWNPYYDEPSNGRYLIHLGASARYRQSGAPIQFNPAAYVGNQATYLNASTGTRQLTTLGLEGALVWGSLSFQGEYFYAKADSGESYDGAYLHVSYFLTGEHRGYKRSSKVHGRVKPLENFFRVDTCNGIQTGRGAWEIAAGYSYVDLTEAISGAGEIKGFIVGLNWYLNPYSRLMLDYNYETVTLGGIDINSNITGLRWQVDF